MAIVNPQDLTNGCNHGNNGCGVDITKLKGNKKQNDGE
jgi:hypothetical protein